MNPPYLSATCRRVLDQLRHDPRSIAMTLVLPSALLALLYYLYEENMRVFDRIGLIMLGVFPVVMMFLVTSIAMLRERTSGTLERRSPPRSAGPISSSGMVWPTRWWRLPRRSSRPSSPSRSRVYRRGGAWRL